MSEYNKGKLRRVGFNASNHQLLITKEQAEYLPLTENDIEDMIKILGSRPKNQKPFYAWFNCFERGVVKIDLKSFVPCKSEICEHCRNYSKLFKTPH